MENAPKARNTSSKILSQPRLQPWGNVGTTPKSKWKKADYNVSSPLFQWIGGDCPKLLLRHKIIKVLLEIDLFIFCSKA